MTEQQETKEEQAHRLALKDQDVTAAYSEYVNEIGETKARKHLRGLIGEIYV